MTGINSLTGTEEDRRMRAVLAVWFVTTFLMMSAGFTWAGTIQGTVTVQGQEKADNVIVYVEVAPGNYTPPGRRPELLHRNLAFSPRVLPVLQGTIVDFPNADAVFHSAFSVSPSNPFELGIYGQGKEKFVQFRKPGIVEVSCHIHPFMKATVVVAQNPYFAVTSANGSYSIHGVPAGRYTVKTSSPSGKPQSKLTSVSKGGTSVLDFSIK